MFNLRVDQIQLTSTADGRDELGGDRAIRHRYARSEVVRLRRGIYADATAWAESTHDGRKLAAIEAIVATRRSNVILSHTSAALMHRLPIIRDRSLVVHITEPPDSSRRDGKGLRVHRRILNPKRIIRLGDFMVTDVEQTILDLARDGEFIDAVAAGDHALFRDRTITTKDALASIADQFGRRGRTRAMGVIEFCTDKSETPLESGSRVVMHQLGFPAPTLQREVATSLGLRRLDFWWEDLGLGGEADGLLKYADDPLGTVLAEKQREAALLDAGVRVVRWGWHEMQHPEELAIRLRAAGLRRALPRRMPSLSL